MAYSSETTWNFQMPFTRMVVGSMIDFHRHTSPKDFFVITKSLAARGNLCSIQTILWREKIEKKTNNYFVNKGGLGGEGV